MESSMEVYEDRLTSFTNWRHGGRLRPIIMAGAGFYHSNWDTDQVSCFNCKVRIEGWSPEHDPIEHHLRASANCSWINNTYMSTLEERLASFHLWPFDIKPLPISMAAAGFYHSNKRTDAVTCFSCDSTLEDWKRDDDPIFRHRRTLRGQNCSWVRKIITVPDEYAAPIPRKAPPMWDHKSKPHKCRICRKVFSPGNQFRKHERDAHHNERRRGGVLRNPSGVGFIGKHRVSKPTRKVVMPGRTAMKASARR